MAGTSLQILIPIVKRIGTALCNNISTKQATNQLAVAVGSSPREIRPWEIISPG